MKKRQKILLLLYSLFTIRYSLFATPVLAQSFDEATGIFTDRTGDEIVSFKWIETLIGNLLKIMLPLIGIASFIMIIIGAFSLITSGSNKESLEKAKKTITSGIFGLFLALLIWFIFYFISQFTGLDINLLEFTIPTN